MRARLLGITLGLLTVLVVALGVPLVTGHADRVSAGLFAVRSGDTRYLAELAAPALLAGEGRSLQADMGRYEEVYGIQAVAVDFDGRVVAASSAGVDLSRPAHRDALDGALAGHATERHPVAWPWRDHPMTIAVPVSGDGRILGAVVTLSPVDAAQARIWRRMQLVGAGGLGILALAALGVGLPTVRWVLRPVRALDSATHEVAAFRPAAGVAEDVGAPELRRLAVSFNAMAAQVRAALHQQRDFVSQASHQLRNPLTVLRLSVDNLDEHVGPDGRPHLELAAQETERLAAVVDRLLELARAEAADPALVPTDVAAVAAARLAAWADAYAARGMPLTLHALRAEAPPVALADPELVGHALDTMLGNALKFAPGAPVRIEVRADAGLVEFAVADAGPGVPPEELAALGRRFWRSPGHQNVEGTGLGLATSRILVESAGGWMQAEALAPHGLRVGFWLPRAPDADRS